VLVGPPCFGHAVGRMREASARLGAALAVIVAGAGEVARADEVRALDVASPSPSASGSSSSAPSSSAPSPSPPAKPARTIEGQLRTEEGVALAGAEIAVLVGETVRLRTATDVGGRFRIALPAELVGPFEVRATLAGLPTIRAPWGGAALDLVMRARASERREDTLDVEIAGERRAPALPPPTAEAPVVYQARGPLLSRLPGTRGDPFAAITSLPSMARPPELSTVYIVRGGQPEDSLTYVDGAPLLHPFHFGGFVAVLPAPFIEAIDLAPGGFGASYGRATAGIIDVSLAPLPKDAVHAVVGLDAIDVGAVASADLGHGIRVAAGARRSHVDAWLGALVGSQIAGQLPRYLDGQAIVEVDLSRHVRVRGGVIASSDDVSVSDPNDPNNKSRKGSWSASGARAHVRIDADVGATGKAFGVFALSTGDDDIVGDPDHIHDTRKQLYGRGEASTKIAEGVRAIAGFDVLGTRIEGERSLSIPISSFGGTNGFSLAGGLTVERIEPGVYAQLQLTPLPSLSVSPGVRADVLASRELVVQPRISARLKVDRSTALRGNVGLYARANVLDAVNAVETNGPPLPVPFDARALRTINAGLGVEHAFVEGVTASIDGWVRVGDHQLVSFELPAVPIYSTDGFGQRTLVGYTLPLASDEGRTRAYGAEFLIRAERGPLHAFVGYAISRSEIRAAQDQPWQRSPLDQTHVLNAAAIVALGAGWELGARFRLAVGVLDSPYPALAVAPKPDPDRTPGQGSPELPPIHSLDLRLEKRWLVAGRVEIAAYLELRNAYDRRSREPLAYNFVYGFPVVGDGLPIIPNIGLRGAL
jgi:hypothetical protein